MYSSSSSFSALRLLCHSGNGLSSQVQRWYGHTSTFVTFSGARFFFYDLELDLSVNLSVPSM